MTRYVHKILCIILVTIPGLLLTMATATAQGIVVYQGETTEFTVEEVAGDTYFWEIYNDVAGLNLAVVPGNCPASEAVFVGGVNTGPTVFITWLMPGTYFVKVTATNQCPTNNIKFYKIEVLEGFSTAIFLEPPPVCDGDPVYLTVEITGAIGPWSITYTDGTSFWTIDNITDTTYTFLHTPTPAVGNTDFWITSVTNGYGLVNDEDSEPVTLTVYPRPDTSPIYRYTPMGKK
jgi:hypothetical protein